jgi:hypothetical protein
VARLVHGDLPAARQRHLGEVAPPLGLHRSTRDLALLHLREERLDVCAEEEELVHVVALERMHRDLGWREREGEPAAAHVDPLETEHVAEERAVGVGIGAVQDDVRAVDERAHHGSTGAAALSAHW